MVRRTRPGISRFRARSRCSRPGMTAVVFEKRILAMYHFTALVACLAIAVYFFTSIQVSKAPVAFGLKVAAIPGNPDFERGFRVQMNNLELWPVFLACA